MSGNDSDNTVPREPKDDSRDTADHTPLRSDTGSHPANRSDSAPTDHDDANRTTPRQTAHASEPTPTTHTVLRTPSDVERLQANEQTRATELVPDHAIEKQLGQGGMGVVYRARDLKLNRVVALKMLLGSERATRSDLSRFLAEAEAVAAIQHENVVQVYNYGEVDGRPYMSLEYCAGGSLKAKLDAPRDAVSGSGSARDAAKTLGQIARGVAAAHALGIVHRDLKPANVLLDATGIPKVADFGLAKRGDGSDVTQTGQVMGTPTYMSPEQAKGESKFVGPQADVWALGVMLYEMLTHSRPFTGSLNEILAKVQNATPIAPRKVIPAIPRDLELICFKCLEKLPHERYPTAKELADDLDRFQRGEPISVRPTGNIERAYKWMKRNPVVSGAAFAVLTSLVIATVVSWSYANDAKHEAEEARKQKREAEDANAREKAEAIARIREEERANQEQRERLQAERAAQLATARELLSPLAAKARSKPLNDFEQQALWQLTTHRNTAIPTFFLLEATRDNGTIAQLDSRAEFALHAATGLDPVRIAEAEKILVTQIQNREVDLERRVRLAVIASRAAYLSPEGSRIAAWLLAHELETTKNIAVRREMAESIVALTNHLEPKDAIRQYTVLLGEHAEPSVRHEFSLAIARTAKRLNADEAARVCLPAAQLLANALRESVTTGIDNTRMRDQSHLFRSLAAVASRLTRDDAAKLCTPIAKVVGAAFRTLQFSDTFDTEWSPGVIAMFEFVAVPDVLPLFQDAVRNPASAFTIPHATRAIATLLRRLPPADASNAGATTVTHAVAGFSEPGVLWHKLALAQSILATLPYLEPAEAERKALLAVEQLAKELANNDDGNHANAEKLSAAFTQLAQRCNERELRRVCSPHATAAGIALAKATYAERARAMNFITLVAPLGAHDAATQIADVLLNANHWEAQRELALAFAVHVQQLTPQDAARISKPLIAKLTATLQNARGEANRLAAATALAAVYNGLPPLEGAQALAKLIEDSDAIIHPELAHGFATIAARLDLRDAIRIATPVAHRLAVSLAKSEYLSHTDRFANALLALAPYIAAEDAAKMLVEAHAKAISQPAIRDLTFAISRVATRLNSQRAAEVCSQALAKTLSPFQTTITNPFAKPTAVQRELVAALFQLCEHLPPDVAAQRLVDAYGRVPHPEVRRELAAGIALFTTAFSPAHRAIVLQTGAFASPHANFGTLALLPFRQPRTPVVTETLVELLKHPFCVGEARRAVLDALESRFRRPFANVLEFAQYAQQHQPHLDLLAVPRVAKP